MTDSNIPVLVVTGSQVFGPVKNYSDIDIVLRHDKAKAVKVFLNSHGINTYQTEVQKGKGYPGYYFQLSAIIFNIICAATDKELQQYQRATDELKKLPPIEDKEDKIKLFRSFFASL